jgi:hypothetical protein
MLKLSQMRKIFAFFIILSLIYYTLQPTYAFQQSSTNYQLEGDFNIFAGSKSSANYSLTDTGGGLGPGISTSTNYGIGAGFQYVLAKSPNIAFTVNASSVSLNVFYTSVATASHTITVTTKATRGYTVYVYDDGNLRNGADDINNVADGAVTAGSEEYGLATSAGSQNISQDTNCPNAPYTASAITTSLQNVASAGSDVTGENTTLCYAASASITSPTITKAIIYTQTVTYIAVGNF